MSRQINLYNAAFRQRRDWLASRNVVLATLCALLIVSLGAAAARWSVESRAQQARAVNTQLLAARADFAELTRLLSMRAVDADLQKQVEAMTRDRDAARVALGLLQGMTGEEGRPVVGEMMGALSRAALDGLWLTGFQVDVASADLEIHGRMTDQALLPGYLRRLEGEAVFQGRRFSALDMQGKAWLPKEPSRPEGAAVDTSRQEKSREQWFVEFALRTTDTPSPANGPEGER